MFVKRTTDIKDILRVVPIETRLREKAKAETGTNDFLTFVQSQLSNPYFYFLQAFEDETERALVGYIVILVIPIKLMGLQQVNILRVYYDPKYRKTGILDTFWNAVDMIARHHKIKKVRIEVTKHEKAYTRRHNFKKYATVMERRIE